MFSIIVPDHALRSQDVCSAISWAAHCTTGDPVFVGRDRDVLIFVGISPAGVVWVTDTQAKLEIQRAALGRLWARCTRAPMHGIRIDDGAANTAPTTILVRNAPREY